MEVTNYLLGYKNLKIVQNSEWFNFSLDSVLLPNFVTLNKNIKSILDIGTGNLPIPLILSTKTSAKITGVEIQKEIYDLAEKTLSLNKLQDQINIVLGDIRELVKTYETESYDIITCNPPYFKYSPESNLNESKQKIIARHEQFLTLTDIFSIAKKLLKNNGVIAIVHRPDRLVEIFQIMSQNNIEPKKLQYIYPRYNSECNMILVEGRKNGKPGLKVLPPLYVHDEKGNYLPQITKYFEEGDV